MRDRLTVSYNMIKEIASNNLEDLSNYAIQHNRAMDDIFESAIQKDLQNIVYKRMQVDRENMKYMFNKRGFITRQEWENESDNILEEFGVPIKK